jgi:Cd2+/Zn2+-exporting ATPase
MADNNVTQGEYSVKETVFYIAGLHCPAEELMVRNRLERVEGVDKLRFNLMTRELTVVHRLDDEKNLQSALDTLELGARLKLDDEEYSDGDHADHDHHGHEHHDHEHHHHEHHEQECCGHDHGHRYEDEPTHEHEHGASTPAASHEHAIDDGHDHGAASKRDKVLLALSGVAAVGAEVVAWSSGQEQSWPVITLALFAIAAGGRETIRKGFVALKNFTLNINFLMMLAVAGAMLIGQWPEAAMVTFLFALAEMIEGYSLDRARNAIQSLMAMTPETAEARNDDGSWQQTPATRVLVGQIVRVRPGERVPLDGVLTSGSSSVNQAPITGESMPVEKKIGDQVFAGTVNERGTFEFRVTAKASNTTLARIIKTVQEAQSERAPTQRFIDNFAKYYTPAVVLFAILVAAIPPLVFHLPFEGWLYKSLVMLVIACPCALVISTPVTVVSGLAAAAKQGVLIKGGVYLEEGRNLKIIALDKTGTLTHGKPQVTDVIALNGQSRDEILQLAATLDAPSEHPVASAIVAAWTGKHEIGKTDEAVQKSGDLLEVHNFHSITGRGVQGEINGKKYFIGNHRLAEENKVCGVHVEEVLDRLEADGKTTVVLSTDKESIAVLGVADTLRDTSIEAVKEMHDMGVRTVVLTGDNQKTAEAIARRVGIDDARGDLLPEDKLAAIAVLLEKHGGVGMVGDGINDAPALAKATMGFAMGAAGTDTAIETADVALMQDDLRKLPLFLRLSRKTSQILVQNIALAIGIKLVFFILALAGHATLWMAVFADMGASLLVVFNGLRLLHFNVRS